MTQIPLFLAASSQDRSSILDLFLRGDETEDEEDEDEDEDDDEEEDGDADEEEDGYSE